MIYLDNGATTLKKPMRVKFTIIKNAITGVANPGRAGHKLATKAGLKVIQTRDRVKSFFHAPNNAEVVFTTNCTEALNLIILGTVKVNGHIITTANEHNSVLRPIHQLTKTHGVTYSICTPNKDGIITAENIKQSIKDNTYLIIVNQTSNVTGATSNLDSIGKVAKENNLLFAVDTAQSAGHEIINMEKSNVTCLAFAGHKGLYGMQGVGGLVTTVSEISPIKYGGTGTNSKELVQPNELPEKLESGTLNTPNILSLNSGISYVTSNFSKIQTKTYFLTNFLLNELNEIKQVVLYSNNPNSGVVSFEIKRLDSNYVANLLNENYSICVRSGLHCAPLIHKHLNTQDKGLIRISISCFNKKYEIKKLIRAVKEIIINEQN